MRPQSPSGALAIVRSIFDDSPPQDSRDECRPISMADQLLAGPSEPAERTSAAVRKRPV